jgi:hypothetical protein
VEFIVLSAELLCCAMVHEVRGHAAQLTNQMNAYFCLATSRVGVERIACSLGFICHDDRQYNRRELYRWRPRDVRAS